MLTRNIAYQSELTNGVRGIVVGVLYEPGGIGSFPEAIVVDMPEYCRPVFHEGEPKWVPLLPLVAVKAGTRMTRQQFPIVAAFAFTVNKAQGLTIKEGVVVWLARSRRIRPESKHGLPFVAWTRSETFAKTVCKSLPPMGGLCQGALRYFAHAPELYRAAASSTRAFVVEAFLNQELS